jgi:amino acid adenylation domain-containing protein
LSGDNLAYVIYTSGSTGKPKGAAMRHGALTNLIGWQLNASSLSVANRTLQYSSLSFDVSFQEIFSTLCAGGTLVLITEEIQRDSERLLEVLYERGVERLFMPFVALQQLAEASERSTAVPVSLREVITAGEQLQITRHVAALFTKLPACVLHNHYGPTETHVVTALRLEGTPAAWPALPAIGRPIANTQVHILDQRLRPAAIGVAGDLYVGGESLARGYLNRPEQTAEKFVPDAFSRERGARLYRTGDRARYLADGNIEFLGRADQQVKVRGYRIEPGEIEATLAAHERIRECAVMVREDAPGDKRLVAYLVMATGEVAEETGPGGVSPHELRAFLKERLPEYMIPAAYVQLDELPLTASGKVDRRSLPATGQMGLISVESYVAPRTTTEEMVAGLWSELLRVERVGIGDNFFELGGHSLLATQVVSRIRHVMGVELSLRSLFAAPTVEAVSELVDAQRRQQQQLVGGDPLHLHAARRDGEIPLSFAQQRLWFLDQIEPGNTFYNVPMAIRLNGLLDVDVLQRALEEITRRHESLRTRFDIRDGQPVQLITEPEPLTLAFDDTSHLSEQERERHTREMIREEAGRPFNLTQGPLLRARLVKQSESEHILLLTMHHIISDGWSIGVLGREVAALYEAFSHAEPSPLEELPIQYADYAAWQREYLTGQRLDEQLSYWRQQLQDAPPVLELPTDRVRPPVQSYRGALHSFTLSPALTSQLKELSQREGVTLFMTLLAAFQTLLSRYSGEQEIVVGTPVAGRTRREVEGLIGFFVNTLALRTDLSGEPSFRELVGRVRETALSAYAHQEVPFEKLVEELQPARDLSRSPLCQVMMVLQNAPLPTMEFGGLRLEGLEVESGTAKFDLTLVMEEGSGGLNAALKYRTDLFDQSTIERMASHFQRLLKSILERPERRISEMEMLSEDERRRLLTEWNDTAAVYDKRSRLHSLFEEQVERTPDAVALIFEDERMSYAELNGRANRLAHGLMRLGVGPESVVGVCVERSMEMVVAVLGVLKAGAAYLPLDPAYPRERLGFMLKDSRASVLLTQERLLEALPEDVAKVVCLDADRQQLVEESVENPRAEVTADNLAYIIYTSGSTGEPKGVMVAHSTICHHLIWRQRAYPLSAQDRFLQKASLSFDISVWEIFGTLAGGAQLLLARPGGQQDSAYLVELISGQRVTIAHFGPAMLEVFLRERGSAECESLRRVFCGGEALKGDLAEEFRRVLPGAALTHQYGPTEACVDVTFCEYQGEDRARRVVPIGRPMMNARIYVLDSESNPVPAGVAGELYIGGDVLARGYLGRAELTAEKFVPDAFGTEQGMRLYRTGDVVRYLADGNLEFAGRVDEQVKVRGFRIELGEIEATLLRHPWVREAVLSVHEDDTGDKRLVAYVVAGEMADETMTTGLRGYLKERLPEYMLPQSFVLLEALPLNANGKIDRRALPAPDEHRPQMEEGFIAPRTPVEEVLAEIWSEVLGIQEIGVHDNFFALGGHSLLATQVASRVREAFQAEFALQRIFAAPTIAELALVIDQSRAASVEDEEMEQLLAELELMSDEESQSILDGEVS